MCLQRASSRFRSTATNSSFQAELAVNTHVVLTDIHKEIISDRRVIEELYLMVGEMHRKMIGGSEMGTVVMPQTLITEDFNQATSLPWIADNLCPPTPDEAGSEEESSRIVEVDGTGHSEEGQPFGGPGIVSLSPQQSLESPSTNAQCPPPNEVVAQKPTEELSPTTVPGPVYAGRMESPISHSEPSESNEVGTELTVAASLQTFRTHNEPFQGAAPTQLSSPLLNPVIFDPSSSRYAGADYRPQTVPDEAVASPQSALPQDVVHHVASLGHTLELLDGQLQLNVNPAQRASNFSQPEPLCDLPHTHNDDAPLTVDSTPSPTLVNHDPPACKRLISRTLSLDEAIPLIETIFTSREEVNTIGDLHGDDAQAFVDTLHQVRSAIFPLRGMLTTFVLVLPYRPFNLF